MAIAYLCTILLFLSLLRYKWMKTSKLPPGPPGLPIVGNIHQMSTRYPWKKVHEWHKVYGPILHFRIGQTTVVSLGTHQVAKDILNKRSTLYSSRPRLVVAGECVAKHLDTALLPYGPRWRQFHAIHTSFMNSRKSQLYRPLQELESRHLLFNLLSTNDFEYEFYRYSSSLMYTLLYGRRFVSGEDPKLKLIGQLMDSIFKSTSLGSSLVDDFPILNYLPRPLARWKVMGDALHRQAAALYSNNLNNALETTSWNWCKQSVLKDAPPMSREELTFALGELFGAGSRTTAGAVTVAVFACVSYPNAMRRAQEELDMTVGSDRLPTFDDIPNLPYTRAFVEEVLRWRPLAPAGVAHAPTRDDEYGGFLIPRGASVVANNWSLEMDEDVFQSPDNFVPERWMENTDLPSAAFGFGKRTCPAQYLARNSLLISVSRLLWAFDIKWKEGQEKMAPDQVDMTHEGIFSKPGPFQATFSIRSRDRREVVRSGWGGNSDGVVVDDLLDTIGREFAAV